MRISDNYAKDFRDLMIKLVNQLEIKFHMLELNSIELSKECTAKQVILAKFSVSKFYISNL